MKYLLRPTDGQVYVAPALQEDPDGLRKTLQAQLDAHDVTFDFCVQFFEDEETTPIEDELLINLWSERDADVTPGTPRSRSRSRRQTSIVRAES